MKSLIAGFGAAAMISSGLVAATTMTADAAPYPGTVATNCHVVVKSSSTRDGTTVAVWVTVAGKGSPSGSATVKVDRTRKSRHADLPQSASGSGSISGEGRGNGAKVDLGKLRPGKYDGVFKFDSKPKRSVYKNCSEGFSFRVTKR